MVNEVQYEKFKTKKLITKGLKIVLTNRICSFKLFILMSIKQLPVISHLFM